VVRKGAKICKKKSSSLAQRKKNGGKVFYEIYLLITPAQKLVAFHLESIE
jgi:hypothetical protein